jgi:hypothetical protein
MEDNADSDDTHSSSWNLSSQGNSKTPRALMGDEDRRSRNSDSSEDSDDASYADETEAKMWPHESVEDWTLRVANIYKAKVKTKSNASVVQNTTPDVPDRPVVILSNRPFRESLLSSISSPDLVERILLVEAELAERRAELSGETLLEEKERIESLITLKMERIGSRQTRLL